MSGVGKALGSVAKGVGKAVSGAVKGVASVVKNFVSADAFKLAALGAGIFIGGGLLGAWPLPSFLTGQAGTQAGIAGTLSSATGMGTAAESAAGTGLVSKALAGTSSPLTAGYFAAEAPGFVSGATGGAVAGGMSQSALVGGLAGDTLAGSGNYLMPGSFAAEAPGLASGAPVAPAMAAAAAPAAAPLAAPLPTPPTVHPFWTHPATRMGGGLLAGAMVMKGQSELDKERYKHERDLQEERLEARQIHYGGRGVRPTRLYRSVIG